MRDFPFGESVVVLIPSVSVTKDKYGVPVPGVPTEVTYNNIALWPYDTNASGSNENVQGVDQIPNGLTVLLPNGSDIKATYQMRVRGELWDVTGAPTEFSSPFTGTGGGISVHLTRNEG